MNCQRLHQTIQSLSSVGLFATPWTVARQASLSITSSWSLLKLISIESVMPSNHLILCRPLLLLPSIFPSIRVFSKESVLHIRHAKSLNHVRLFETLWTVARQAPLSMRLSTQEYWSGLPFPPPGDLPNPGIKLVSLTSPALAGRFYTTSTTWIVNICVW